MEKKQLQKFYVEDQFDIDNELVKRFNKIEALSGEITVKGINPYFTECLTPFEVVVHWTTNTITGSLMVDDFSEKDTTIYSFRERFPSADSSLEEIFALLLIGDENENETLLDYLLKNDFILFVSTGSYVEDMFLANELYQKYWLGDDIKEEDLYSNTAMGRLLAMSGSERENNPLKFNCDKSYSVTKEKPKAQEEKVKVKEKKEEPKMGSYKVAPTPSYQEEREKEPNKKTNSKDEVFEAFNKVLDELIDALKNTLE